MGSDIEELAGALDGVVELEGLAEVAGHGLLDIDVLAGLEGGLGHGRVPVIDGGAEDDVDVLSFHHLAVVLVALDVAAGLGLDAGDVLLDAVLGDVAHGGEGDVVFLEVIEVEAHVGAAALVANADEADDELVVGSEDVGGRGLVLPIDGRAKAPGGGQDGGGGGGALEELATVGRRGGGFGRHDASFVLVQTVDVKT